MNKLESRSFGVVYRFKVTPGQKDQFMEAWTAMTKLLREYEGSLGSRLHLSSNGEYIAYALWPHETTFRNFGSKLPDSAVEIRQAMRSSCERIETEYELEIVQDLLLG